MIKKIAVAFFALMIPVAACAQQTPAAKMPSGIYTLDPTHASLVWRVNHLGLSKYTARFTRMNAKLDFNAADPTKSKLEVTVDPLSVRTDYPDNKKTDFDKELATGKGWFNAEQYKNITFTSTRVEKTGENTGKLYGDLTFLGVTKPLVLDVRFNGAYLNMPFAEMPALGFSATGTFKRSEWGMGTYIPNIGDEVELVIEVEFHKSS